MRLMRFMLVMEFMLVMLVMEFMLVMEWNRGVDRGGVACWPSCSVA
ncbi:MAG: hypothetical protein O3A31_06695 [Planctomycetota bacterium]|nr:hypothetical protein [Planctomycetota bacterium]